MADNAISRCDEALAVIESGEATREQVLWAMDQKQKLWDIYRAISFKVEQGAIQWIEKHGEIEDGTKRFYVGTQTTRKCKNPGETVRTILENYGPDDLVRCLSTSCFRPATAIELLGSDSEKHFDTVVEKDLKTGAPKKKLKTTMPKELTDGRESEE